MISNKCVNWFVFARRTDPVGQIKAPGDLATVTVNFQRNTLDKTVLGGSSNLRSNPFIRCLAGVAANPTSAMNQSASNWDHCNAIYDAISISPARPDFISKPVVQ